MDKIYDLSFLALYLMQVTLIIPASFLDKAFSQLFLQSIAQEALDCCIIPNTIVSSWCASFSVSVDVMTKVTLQIGGKAVLTIALDALLDLPWFQCSFSVPSRSEVQTNWKRLFQIETILPF